MQNLAAAAFAIALLIPALAIAQSSKSSTTKDTTVTLTGCVSDSPMPGGDFTFTDNVSGSKYRLTGKAMKSYAGQQVEIVSGPDKKLAVKGGLYPSPNIAAQAGGIDPAQAAIARQPGGTASGTGDAGLREFRVARVKTAGGACR